ncbi:MAG: NAD(P)/FAD-dependent oxidoreductase [Desulfobacterales bacterium]|nr:NAD(P)/FAD-dependent oxidoreductase [Desulfobacterales bacterium]
MKKYDAIVVGSGTAGQTAAYLLNDQGLDVGLVEKSDRPGGVCALSGCQAKKWFYEVTETAARARHLEGRGVSRPPETDWAAILAEKNSFTAKVPDATVKGLEGSGIDYIPGNARFSDHETLEVDGKPLEAAYFVLAVGARPGSLPFDGSEHLTVSRDFLELERLPEKIVFVGGGFISFEFAHFAARLGPKNRSIKILEAGDRPLGPFDAEMVALLVAASQEEGIEVITGIEIDSIEKKGSGFAVQLGSGEVHEADLVVHGAGRAANIEGLRLDNAGIQTEKRGIVVDPSLRTTNPRVFAVGDCAATLQLARVADFEARVAAESIVAEREGGKPAKIDYSAAPALLFTYPQYGMIGKTEDALKKESVRYFKSFGRKLSWPTYRRVGMRHAAYKILVDEDNRILGGHILSDNASGLLHTLRLAMVTGMTAGDLHRTSIMAPYPSRESDLIYMLSPFLE